jgi:hypothetical protein
MLVAGIRRDNGAAARRTRGLRKATGPERRDGDNEQATDRQSGGSTAMMARMILAATVGLCAVGASLSAGRAAPVDYPTEALADYVFGCMASNGQTQDSLRRCSCSIDVVASIIPYDKYMQASTVLSLTQVPGENMSPFRDSPWTKGVVDDLRRAQLEAELRCF